jgi:hypothetical protein
VYIALKGDRTAPIGRADWQRRILTLSAARSIAGGWEYPPGRPEVVATLPARAVELVAFGATRLGPVAMVRHAARSSWIVADPPETPGEAATPPLPGELELVIYASSQWRRLELPWVAEGGDGIPSGPFWLGGSTDELTVFAHDSAAPAVRAYTGKLPAVVGPKQRRVATTWTVVSYPLTQTIAGTTMALPVPELVCRVEGNVVAAVWTSDNRGELRLFWLRSQRPAEEGPAVGGVPQRHSLVPMDGSGRLAVIWGDAGTAAEKAGEGSSGPESGPERSLVASGSNDTGLQVREISATTG